MRRPFRKALIILAIFFLLAPSDNAIAKGKKKGVILSTVDLDEDYEVLGLVYYQSNELNPKKIHDTLRKKAERMNADYVIGITYYSNAGYLYATGTAVKLIEKDQ